MLLAWSMALSVLGVCGVIVFLRNSFLFDPRQALANFLLLLLASFGNAIYLLLPGYTSYPFAMLALTFLIACLLRARGTDEPGSSSGFAKVAWLLAGSLILWCFVVDAFTEFGIFEDRWRAYGISALVWLAMGLLMARHEIGPRSFSLIGVFVVGVQAAPSIFFVSTAWAPCGTDDLQKCTLAGALYRGFAGSENFIAITAAFTMLASIKGLKGKERLVALALTGAIILATGSRTALATIGVTLLWLAIATVIERRRGVAQVPLVLSLTLALSVLTLALYLVYTALPATLSRRGRIWISVRGEIEGRAMQGVGLSKWEYLQQIGQSPDHFFHSGYVLALFSGGFVALLLLGLVFAFLMMGTDPTGNAISLRSLVVLMLGYSLTEVLWNPLAVDAYTWLIVGIFCLCSRVGESSLRERDGGRDQETSIPQAAAG